MKKMIKTRPEFFIRCLWKGLVIGFWEGFFLGLTEYFSSNPVQGSLIFLQDQIDITAANLIGTNYLREIYGFPYQVLSMALLFALIGLVAGIIIYFPLKVIKRISHTSVITITLLIFISMIAGFILGFLWTTLAGFETVQFTSTSGNLLIFSTTAGFLTGTFLALCFYLFKFIPVSVNRFNRILRIAGIEIILVVFILIFVDVLEYGHLNNYGSYRKIQNPANVMLIGIDGLDWSILNSLIRQGKLPNIKTLINQGVSGEMKMTWPVLSPVLWTSIITGKSEKQHGISGFLTSMKKSNEGIMDWADFALMDSRNLKVRTVPEILTEMNISCGMINWFYTWPVKKINGFMISDRFLYPGLKARVYPDSLESMVNEKILETKTDIIQDHSLPESDSGFISGSNKNSEDYQIRSFIKTYREEVLRDRTATAVALNLLEKQKNPQFFGIYYRSVDSASHFFYKDYFNKAHPDLFPLVYGRKNQQKCMFESVITNYYEEMDRTVGELTFRAGKNTTVIIVSDHGFGVKFGGLYTFDLNPFFERTKLLKIKDGARPDIEGSYVLEKSGNIFFSRARYIKMTEKCKGRTFKNILAEAQGNVENLSGEVKPEQGNFDVHGLVAFLQTFKTIDNKKVFIRFREIDNKRGTVLAVVNPEVAFTSLKLDGDEQFSGDRIATFLRFSGNHRFPSVFIMSGNNVKKACRIHGVSIYDISPTLLYLLGLPAAKDMNGRVLTGAFDSSYIRSNPVQWIDTYDAVPLTHPATEIQMNDEVESGLREQLRNMGYIR